MAAKVASSIGRERSTPAISAPSTAEVGMTFMDGILSLLDLDARLPYGAAVPRSRREGEGIEHGTTERQGGGGERRSLGDRRGHRAAVREGGGQGRLRGPRRRAGQAGRGRDRGERRPGHLRRSARAA